jgi:subtilisin family serine protease
MNLRYVLRTILKVILGLALGWAFANSSKADTIKVAVIDTGFDFKSDWSNFKNIKRPKVCKYGHKDFTNTSLNDNEGHGTHVAGLISQYAGDSDYCLLILKNYNLIGQSNDQIGVIKSIEYAIKQKVDIINYSGGGIERSELECSTIKKALDNGIIVVTALGNYGTSNSSFYPAMCDDRILKVANIDIENRAIELHSNLNNDAIATRGTDIKSLLPNNKMGFKTGTSQATAIITGKLIKTLSIRSNKHDL